MSIAINHTVTERFLKYTKVDTQSNPNSTSFPSTEKQKDLAKILVQELQELGIEDAHMGEYGYVYATLPSNTEKNVPVICFCSHMDTSPDCSGKNVKAIIHENYQGQDIELPNNNIVIKTSMHPELLKQIGNDIITADGTTLLGADNKAGVAEIMDAITYFSTNPDVKHGTIKILFTPDEEIGHGVDHVDIKKLGAQFAYTVDGQSRGHVESQTFSADGVEIDITGVSIHPGYAKGRMESALKIAAEIIASLPKDRLSPETTEGMEGFISPSRISGGLDKASLKFIIRDFDAKKLKEYEDELKSIVDQVMKNYPNSTANFIVKEQYRNLKNALESCPEVMENALEAIKRSGMTPVDGAIRGGTDGSRLSAMGLPCPNIFAGEHAFHSKQEWVSKQDMEKAAETIINLCKIWEERAN